MKLSYEDKVQIYELRKQGISFKRLLDKYGMNLSNLKYLVRLIDRYGIEIVKKGKSHYYSPELKQEMIDKVLMEGCSHRSVSLDYAFPSSGLLSNWQAQYKKTGILLLRKQEGDQLK
ncbi:Transposase [Streptococcus oralis]|uniref:Transposase n=1 Tax=Streptococcus oralis TaxID=1303 RepID=A0A428BUS2_STROR|nr:Transposase [Streptococcus oralis]